MTRRGIILTALLLALAFANMNALAQSAASQAEPAPKKAEDVFKNIQVLKGVPSDQIFPAMRFIAASLGVQCGHCHVMGKFDKDDKENKKTARKMMDMMFAINKANFNGQMKVTCNSCHHGAAKPEAIPEIASAMPAPMPAHAPAMRRETPGGHEAKAAMPPMPRAQKVLAKYVQAVGGEEALSKITSRDEKGTLTGFGPKGLPVEIYAKAPDKRISIVQGPHGPIYTAFDGTNGWMTGFGGHIQDMEGADVYHARLDADIQLLADTSRVFRHVRIGRPEKIGDKETWVLLGITRGQPPVKLYFDKDSGLLLRQLRYTETPVGRYPSEVDYADYREVDGVKIPFRWTVARPGNAFTLQVNEVRQNVPVDDSKFAKPAQPVEQKPPGQ